MRSLGTRRVAQAAGAAMVAVIALGGCSAGQVAETAILKAPISGLDTQSPDGTLLVRNLQVVYNSPEGYPAGGNAPIQVSLFNQTEQPMTVLISSRPPAEGGGETAVSARQVGVGPLRAGGAEPSEPAEPSAEPSGAPSADPSAAPDPSASASAAPAGSAAQPARFTIAPLSSQTFLPGDTEMLQAIGLSGRLAPGYSLALTIEVSTSATPLEVLAPFAIPTSPASRGPAAEGEGEGGH
ncbi:hypothetical protein [Paractinoplanes rishiriensis]|uniref:Lipoprotein LpqE n=1 Tax=Paractinoplanes rishiriensis TaxID=1050105 RepID=A0A919K0F0_9ACTN|nr:hypothetical protein [Actinoplanes rishiriensis]GIE98008.1 hypothetical protein Ari01nite_54730 [Actinoplanes rishiriensis]